MGRFPLLVCGFGAVISTSVVMCRLSNTIQKGLEFFSSVALRSIANLRMGSWMVYNRLRSIAVWRQYFLINLFHEGRRFAFCRLLLRYLHLRGGVAELFPPIFLLVIYSCIGGSAWIPLSVDSSAWEMIPNFLDFLNFCFLKR